MKSVLKIAIAITGASGAVYAKVLLDKLFLLKDQYEELCEKYNVKEICVAQIHISQPFNNNYKIYGTGEAGEKKYYIDMIENGHNLPRKTLVPTYNINTKLMENSIVVWNVQNEPGANY